MAFSKSQAAGEHKKLLIPPSAVVSFLLGAASLVLFLVQGYRLIAYPEADLALLSGETLRAGRYVQGEIREIYTVQAPNGHAAGNDGTLIKLRTYEAYTVRIAEGRYIRVWIFDHDTLSAMERIVQGAEETVPFSGQVRRRSSELNTSWYARNPDYTEGMIVSEYEIWETSPHAGRNRLLAGLYGMGIAGMIYWLGGGIHRLTVRQEDAAGEGDGSGRPSGRGGRRLPRYAAGMESELAYTRRRLEGYRKKEREHRIEACIGAVLAGIGWYLDFVSERIGFIKWLGLALLIYGIKSVWICFLHSKGRLARRIAGFLGVTSLQEKRETDEALLREMEREAGEAPAGGKTGKIPPELRSEAAAASLDDSSKIH